MLLKMPPKSFLVGAAGAIALICAGGVATAQQAQRSDLVVDEARNIPHLPPTDTSKLPTTFAGAAAWLPSNPSSPQRYKPKSKRDFTGIWLHVGGNSWDPLAPSGLAQNAPLAPQYATILKKRVDDRAAGRPTGDPTAACNPPGMPRMMTMLYPMEIVMNDNQVNLYAEYQEQQRRIFTDGRKLDAEPDPTFRGQSVGRWEGNVLKVVTIGLRGDTNIETSGMPHSDKLIVYERFWLSDDNTLNDEITLVDPKALTRPWTVTKGYKRAAPDLAILPYLCTENNRNPPAADGTTRAILK
jgi:hypothetical protein